MCAPRPAQRHGGYTLLELMIVVVIIAVVMALAVPGIVNTLRENRSSTGAIEAVRMFRIARFEAVSRGTAHAVHWTRTDGAGGTKGRFDLLRGPIASCQATVWSGAGQTAVTWLAPLDFGNSPYQVASGVDVRASFCDTITTNATTRTCTNASSDVWICYTPSGRLFWRLTAAGAWFSGLAPTGGPAIAGGFTFGIQRFDTGSSAATSPLRIVFVPYGASTARVQL